MNSFLAWRPYSWSSADSTASFPPMFLWGNGFGGTSWPRKLHNGSHPSLTSYTRSLSFGAALNNNKGFFQMPTSIETLFKIEIKQDTFSKFYQLLSPLQTCKIYSFLSLNFFFAIISFIGSTTVKRLIFIGMPDTSETENYQTFEDFFIKEIWSYWNISYQKKAYTNICTWIFRYNAIEISQNIGFYLQNLVTVNFHVFIKPDSLYPPMYFTVFRNTGTNFIPYTVKKDAKVLSIISNCFFRLFNQDSSSRVVKIIW